MVPGSLATLIRRLPKIELHLHLEGSIRPSLLGRLARKNGVSPPSLNPSGEEEWYAFQDFSGFLECFGRVCQVLARPEDLVCAAEALFDELAAEKVLYAEIFLSPVIYPLLLGWSVLEVMPQIHAVAEERQRQTGLQCRYLFDSVRQWGPKALEQTIQLADRCRQWNVIGIGMGGDEGSLPAHEFADLYTEARRRGLRTTVHAGETCGAGNVWEALEFLHPERIGHGLGAAADPSLQEELKRQGISLNLCLTSNLRTGVCPELADHPIHRFYQSRLPFSINTDDPAIFDTTLHQEITLAAQMLSLDYQGIRRLQCQAAQSAFLPEDQKVLLVNRLETGE